MRRIWLLFVILYAFYISCGNDDKHLDENGGNNAQITNTVFVSSIQINDCRDPYEDGLVGNCDGAISANEIVDLLIEFKNDTDQYLDYLSATVFCDDPDVEILAQRIGYPSYGQITPSETVGEIGDGFPFTNNGLRLRYTRYLEHGESKNISCGVEIETSAGAFDDVLDLVVNDIGAELALQKYKVRDYIDNDGVGGNDCYDCTGNSDNIPDPGERVQLNFTIKNIGTSATRCVQGALYNYTNNNYISLIHSEKITFCSYPDETFGAGNSQSIQVWNYQGFEWPVVEISSDCPKGAIVPLVLWMQDMYGNNWESEFDFTVGEKAGTSNGCESDCGGKECGGDGCGGSCGWCDSDEVCENGECVYINTCQPKCSGKECGSDGCGGGCGSCNKLHQICTNNKCVQEPCSNSEDCIGSCCFKAQVCKDSGEYCEYVDQGNGTILAVKEKVLYQKTPSSNSYTYSEAVAYCNNLDFAGYKNWYVIDVAGPTNDGNYWKNCGQDECNDYDPIFDGECGWYWSSKSSTMYGEEVRLCYMPGGTIIAGCGNLAMESNSRPVFAATHCFARCAHKL